MILAYLGHIGSLLRADNNRNTEKFIDLEHKLYDSGRLITNYMLNKGLYY